MASDERNAKIRKYCERRLKRLETERTSWFEHWKELSKWILPRRGRFMRQANQNDKGRQNNTAILDETATIAARNFASGMQSGCSSPARPWFKVGLSNKRVKVEGEVKAWCQEVATIMLEAMANSNFYNALGSAYEELGVFGTGVVIIEDDLEDGIRSIDLTVGEYYLANGRRNVVNTLYRVFQMTVSQMVEQFGLEQCSEDVQRRYREGHLDDERDVVHAIEPNDGRVVESALSEDKPFRSVFFEKDHNSPKLLELRGYDEFPAMCPRWNQSANEAYGRSCGMDVLPATRSLQHLERRAAELIDKISRPPMTAPASLKNEQMSGIPGGVTFVPDGSRQKFEPSVRIEPGAIEAVEKKKAEVRRVVQRGFYEDLFLMLSQMDGIQPRQNMEVLERREEKMLMLGPALERLQDELFDPAVKRVFAILMRQRRIPPPPAAVLEGGGVLKIEYTSIMAQAQKAVGLTSIERLLGFVGNLAAAKPGALDKVDEDAAVEAYADQLGVPAGIVVTAERVAELRAARAQQQQQQALLEAAPVAVDAAQVLASTETGAGKSALAMMMGV